MLKYSCIDWSIVVTLLIAGMALSVRTKKLTFPAAITGGLTGLLIFAGAGFMGLTLLCAFFLLGTLATRYKRELKPGIEADGDLPERRKTGQVLANGGVATVMALLALADPSHAVLYRAMLAACFAAATSDTLSSELGMVHGRRFFNILSFKKEAKGLNGVISLEGTLAGILGAFVIALLYACFEGLDLLFLFIVVGGVMGNLMDSVLGALFERRKMIGNDVVNFLNTLFAALVFWLLTCL